MPNEEIKERNAERVLQTAYDLFLAHGIENTTKEMLVRASDVSRSSVDRYSPSKVLCVLAVAIWFGKKVESMNNSPLPNIIEDTSLSGAAMLRKYLEAMRALLCWSRSKAVFFAPCKG